MRALLTLYMVNEFPHITDEAYREEISFVIFAGFVQICATSVLGGMIADKFIGFKKSSC